VNPTAFSCDWKWRDTSPKHFLCQSNYSQPHRYLWKCATVHDQTCP